MSDSETMTIELPRTLADEIRRLVAAGQFTSNSRAVEAVLREWRDARSLDGYSTDELRRLVGDGIASGASSIGSLAELKREARRRWEDDTI